MLSDFVHLLRSICFVKVSAKPTPPPIQALKPVGVAAVAVLALYSRQPPSSMKPGTVIKAGGGGMAACAFLPAVLSNGCSPLRAAVTDTGSLVVFKGGQEVGFTFDFLWLMVLMLVLVLGNSGVADVSVAVPDLAACAGMWLL